MMFDTSRRLLRRFVSIALIVSLTAPASAGVGFADDLEPPDLATPITAPAPTQTPEPTVTSVPAPTPSPRSSPAAEERAPATTPAAEERAPADEDPAPSLAACVPPERVAPTTWQIDGNDALNAMRASIVRTLDTVRTREHGVSGPIVGFRPGTLYAHIYARDSATIAPTAQYFYDLPYLTRPVEEFLALQYDGVPGDPEDAHWRTPGQRGALSGTIGGGEIVAAKMLVVSDEEPSVVSMAYSAVKAGAGPGWLRAPQAGKPRIQRLNEAMDWLFERRFDQPLRLIKRGNTTDWGDVAVGVGHSSGSYTKEPAEWTASIYDQAWTYRALLQLAEMNRMIGEDAIAEHQLQRARLLRQSVAERLWQPDRGYFRTRIPVPPLAREIDEDRIVSIANGVAVYSGITDPTERKPIFTALERARIEAGAPKPGLSLWPPYPVGFFDYPQMSPGRYQNGAVWDWWGGMQISAEFWTGYSALGRQHLELVAADWAREPGEVYEWQEAGTGTNLGSPAYAGAAATMGEAIVAGLFGVELGPVGWALTARLGAASGGIHAYQPPSGCVLDYWHTYAGDRIAVEWESNHPKSGTVRVVVPDNARVEQALLDQQPVPVTTEQLGDDTLAVLSVPAPTGKHRLELQLSGGTE